MPWLKQGDAAANHPIVLAAVEMEDADDRILNECFGFVGRCATQAAAYEQDYIITVGTARHMAGSLARYNALIAAAKYCGYLTEVQVEIDGEQRKAFKLVEDNDLFHMILKAEREWNNQRKRDTRNPELTVRVRMRDGDACRYCGKSVAWGDNKSGRGATYDHINPGQGGTVDTLVVCCRECNGKRGDDPESTWKTLPVPAEPLYGPATVAFIEKHGTPVQPSYTRTPTTPAATVHPAAPAATEPPAATEYGSTPESNPDPGHRYPGSRYVGTGRDGTGQAGKGGSGQEAHPPTRPQPQNKTRRRRPRSRGRN
ncbi:HNH endonuclease [Arthrobacter sp. ISL-72]|uniref:HNH endonuclease n=1 Tax=Arthrobacter sp. ISL-72 TaxID=2819114 RepID=UPI001BE743EC|nr:HNH endonuclease [Arthrobacter sp. ISL-72]MBT2594747.1 hypothetical protein [Arthrobacter sp. ISL-72]